MSPGSDDQSQQQALQTQFAESSARFRVLVGRHCTRELAYLGGASLVLVAVKDGTALTVGLGAIGVVGLLLLWRLGQIGEDLRRTAQELARIGTELNLTETSKERHIYASPLIGPLMGPLIFSLLLAHLVVSVGATIAALVRIYTLVRK